MTRTYLLRLSWPSPVLSSNSRAHWATKSRVVKAYRSEAAWEAKSRLVTPDPSARLSFSFFPPDRRKRDASNLPHMMKAAIDGIADAMGCDDNAFLCTFPAKLEEPAKGGAVLVTVTCEGGDT